MRKRTNYTIQYGETYALPPDLPAKLGLLGACLGVVLTAIACGTPHWVTSQGFSRGLWVNQSEVTATLRVSQAMIVIAVVAALANSATSAAYFLPNRFRGRKVTCFTNIILSAVAVVSLLTCVSAMGSGVSVTFYLNWSFYMAVSGAVAFTVGCLMWIVQVYSL